METGSSGDSDSEYEARVSSGTEEDEGNITTADGIADGSIFKKRKRNRVKFDSRTEQSVKRIKAAYSADYLDVFNQTLQGAVAGIHEDDWPFHDPSQIGMTYWSSAEKERFFLALERYGRCNLSAVVQAVRSKSSLQVEEYIQLLARGSVEYETKQRKNALVRTIDIPAAVELTQETCHALEQSADALGLLIKEDDSLKEQNRYGEDWLITEQSCLSATQPLNDLSQLHETASPKDQLDLALTLFDVPQIIQLSSHVFMNSPDQSYSWPALALPATLFNAMARIRAADTLAITKGTRPPNPVVRKDDVLVALDNLALAHDSAAFWRDAPRRLGLSVHETHPGKPYSYNRRDERTNTFSAISKAPALSLDEAEILLSPFAEDPDLGEALSVKQSIEKPLFDLVLEEPSHQTSSPTSTRRLSSPISDSDASRSGTPAAPSGGLRRSSRSASKGRVDYSMHGLGARDPFAFGPLDDGNSSDGAGGKVDGMDVDVDVG
ncbi:hypothetical protein FH972_021619 [Carpinus fangiana]|uniref:SANT domain-containing protein n=1 Tax=Carpinus fangiana TaxID=176857 RepID=A0A5N6KPT9_9ROSI|nr:hypothetical protein FH972_021619 [Carpinus fangiana]